MSDHSTAFVPKISVYPDSGHKAGEILNWLVSENIVDAEISGCILGGNGGYRIAAGSEKILGNSDLSRSTGRQQICGLEIIMVRTVFDTGENGLDSIVCPYCRKELFTSDYTFINDWWEGSKNTLTCNVCATTNDINEYIFRPEWAFSNLGFRFWNFPEFRPEFRKDLASRLGCAVKTVYQHI